MTPRPDKSDPVWELIDAACYDDANAVQLQQLDRRLCDDPEACDLYNDYCQLHAELIFRAKNQESFEAFRSVFEAPQQSPHLSFLSNVYQGAVGYFSQEVPFALLMGAVIVGLGLFAGSLISVTHYAQLAGEKKTQITSPQIAAPTDYIGRITGMADCRWAEGSRFKAQGSGSANDQSLIANPLSPISLGDRFALASGLVEITYDTGAKVILQGPCTYEMESRDGGFLSVGRLTARLDSAKPQAGNRKSSLSTIHYPLFTIKTPSAVVTDLGTEFGVEVTKEGTTTSRVFRGSVSVQAISHNGIKDGDAQILRENQSARVESGSNRRATMLPPSAKPIDFVREIPRQERTLETKRFDLVDVVAGGNGFSSRRGMGIDPTSGQVSDKDRQWQAPPNEYLIGDGKYHRVDKRPFVDGVFIPDGSNGPVQVDSAGHTFASFPNTKNETAGFLWAGGTIPNSSPFAATRTDLGGIDYATTGHGLLMLHANKGITFDLQAIRRANPDWRPTRFRATAGITSDASVADFWVLVDGHIRFRRWQTNSTYGAIPISIALSENERFLTLAATDGGNGISADWTIFGDPQLELTKKGTSGKSKKQYP